MTFPGMEHRPPVAEEKPLSTFTYKTFGGRAETVRAHYVNFMPGHVAFFRDVGGDMNVLVLAEANTNVRELREME